MKAKIFLIALFISAICIYLWGTDARLKPLGGHMYQDKHILLDFDGTIADSWEVSFEILNSHAADYNFEPMSSDAASELTTAEILKKYQIGFLSQLNLVRKIKSSLTSKMISIPIFQDFSQSLADISSANQKVVFSILTSNSEENVKKFIDKHQLKYITNIFSNSSLFGKHRSIRSYIKHYSLNPKNILYIGDEVRDMEGAKKANVASMAVGWGYDPISKLESTEPNYLAKTPEEAKKFIQDFLNQ